MENRILVGWREWVALPELGIEQIKAKVDTGARTSCIHEFKVEPYVQDGEKWVRFWVHPNQDDVETEIQCQAKVKDERTVTDSGGHREMRYVIETLLSIDGQQWPVEATLTNRDTMKFRMLLGRTAMVGRIVVDPELSHQTKL